MLVNSASTPCSLSKLVKSVAVCWSNFLEDETEEPFSNNETGGSL